MDGIDFSGQALAHDFASRSSRLNDYNAINASAILELNQRHTIQIVATVASSISLTAALCAMYWFILMRRNFRRDLVLMLILGGFWKSLWFVIQSAVTFTRGQIKTDTTFCQASGYLLQVGFEACDISVLFMSMHMYYQIFPPSKSKLGHDGLYRVRHWVVGAFVVFPNLSAGLAFLNPRHGYMAQGAFCSIPLRPLWYRLGLFWIPRYLVWIYIIYVAIRIYRHVGSEFRLFGQEKASDSSVDMPGQSSVNHANSLAQRQEQLRRNSQHWSSPGASQVRHESISESIAPHDTSISPWVSPRSSRRESHHSEPGNASRGYSTPNWASDLHDFGFDKASAAPISASTPVSRRGSRQINAIDNFLTAEMWKVGQRQGSVTSTSTRKPSLTTSTVATLSRIDEGNGTPPDLPSSPRQAAGAAMNQRRRAIQRQLRLLFIYPVVYMILWMIPFVVNIMNYTDYYAQHPIFPLQIVQVFTLTAMTHVDVVVFCWRERPWKHIPGADGTFLGSFMWWRYLFKGEWIQSRRHSRAVSALPEVDDADAEKVARQPRLWVSLHSSIFRKSPSPSSSHKSSTNSAPPRLNLMPKRAFSGGSDRKVLEAERAHERLALERADYELHRQSLQETRSSVMASQSSPTTHERKEWFDKEIETELSIERQTSTGDQKEEV